MLFIWLMLIFMIVVLLMVINSFFSLFSKDKWSNSPFECGMDQVQKKRTPLYMHFIFISLVFLVFDVELVVSIPIIYTLLWEHIWNVYWLFFFSIMTVGLLLEVKLGTIDWKN